MIPEQQVTRQGVSTREVGFRAVFKEGQGIGVCKGFLGQVTLSAVFLESPVARVRVWGFSESSRRAIS